DVDAAGHAEAVVPRARPRVDAAAGGQVVVAAFLLPGGREVQDRVGTAEVAEEPGVPADLRREGRLVGLHGHGQRQGVRGELDLLGDAAGVRPRLGEVVGEDGFPVARAGRAPGGVPGGAVDGVRRRVQRQLVHGGAVPEPAVADPAAPGHHREAPEPLALPQQLGAADPQPLDPAAVARPHGHLRVARGQRDLVVPHGTDPTALIKTARAGQRRRRRIRTATTADATARAAAGAAQRSGVGGDTVCGAGPGAYRPRGGAWSTSSALRPIIVRRAWAASATASRASPSSPSATGSRADGGTSASGPAAGSEGGASSASGAASKSPVAPGAKSPGAASSTVGADASGAGGASGAGSGVASGAGSGLASGAGSGLASSRAAVARLSANRVSSRVTAAVTASCGRPVIRPSALAVPSAVSVAPPSASRSLSRRASFTEPVPRVSAASPSSS